MNGLITVPISIGELFDKISILQIKFEELSDKVALEHISLEKDILITELKKVESREVTEVDEYMELYKINKTLWKICDERREMDARRDFSRVYVELSRAEYKTNDKRALIKKRINQKYNSKIFEVKSYGWFNED